MLNTMETFPEYDSGEFEFQRNDYQKGKYQI